MKSITDDLPGTDPEHVCICGYCRMFWQCRQDMDVCHDNPACWDYLPVDF